MEGKIKSQQDISKRYNRNIRGFVSKIIFASFIIIILVPSILEYLIYRNEVVSVLSNEEWSGFLGSFLGGVIGSIIAGIATIYGIKLTIEHNTEIVMGERLLQDAKDFDNEVKRNRPFMYLIHKGGGGGMQDTAFLGDNPNNVLRYNFELVNIGMNTAINVSCNINYYNFNGKVVERDIFNNKKIIQKDDSFQFHLGIPKINRKCMMTIRFQDLLENNYEQEISFEYLNDKISFNSHTPFIKDKEELYVR